MEIRAHRSEGVGPDGAGGDGFGEDGVFPQYGVLRDQFQLDAVADD